MRSTFTISILLLLFSFTFREETAYPRDYFTLPVSGPLRLSGTFGELRPGHFHAGIDLKGSVGDVLLAAAEGYVSRVTVSPDGYGKVIYLSHPNGYTTIYAHMDHFNPELEAYVRSHQYAEESFSVDLHPEPGQFPVEKGAIIGAMGLTGHSFGPHLHFEVRDRAGKAVINPLNFGLPVADHRPPSLRRLRLYAIDEQGASYMQEEARLRKGKDNHFFLVQGDTLYTTAALSALGLEVYDQQDEADNRNGIYSLKLYYDDSLSFYFDMERFLQEETRYLNAHLDYAALEENGEFFNRLYRMPGNAFSNYVKEEGVVPLREGGAVQVHLQAGDISGNTSELAFWLKRIPAKAEPPKPFYNYQLPFDAPSIIRTPSLFLHFPGGSLYEDLNFHYEPVLEDSYGVYSLVHHVHHPGIPLHQPFDIGIRPTLLIPDQLRDKAFIAYCGSGGAVVNCGGQWKDGFLQGRARSLGAYCILTDDEPPVIEPLNSRGGPRRAASIAFRISDNYETAGDVPGLSYRGTVDGRWVLFEYDAKSGRLEYFFEATLVQGVHQLRLEVKDAMDNTAVFEQAFSR